MPKLGRPANSRTHPRRPVNLNPVWNFIAEFIQERGYPPTYKEIGAGCFISEGEAYRMVIALEQRGVIVVTPHIARGMKLLTPPGKDK